MRPIKPEGVSTTTSARFPSSLNVARGCFSIASSSTILFARS
ncbi:MAG TPA: hypothetical protein VNI84_08900 [Pyrinomonadaceae bacterium]|nr:hypothetical protein [Pyrinomonadaceae bacterium]